MSKVLRLHTSGYDTLEDWQKSSVYGSEVINQIEDPQGASASHEITSIPSPFARIDLVKQAFKNVADSKNLDGQTIFHKMVSDSLDVGEIFFKAKNYSDRVKIIYWDKTEHIAELRRNGNEILAQTLEMYLKQDATAYNFSNMRRIFILGYTGGLRRSRFDVLGATSPATLFFSIANDLSYVTDEIPFNNDKPFDSAYNPLYKRDEDFIKCLFALRDGFNGFAAKFPEVNAYLNLTYQQLSTDLKDEIDNTTANNIANYNRQTTTDGNDFVEIIDGLFFPMKQDIPRPKNHSDFEIRPTRSATNPPLALPCTKASKYDRMKLTHATWDGNNPAPYIDKAEISKRRLPQTNEQIPYLTISDFLEERIIKMPYKLNSQAFYDANKESQNVSYFLPLKDLFFEYFTAEDVINDRMIEFHKNTGGVKVVLHIPVKGGTIDYERIYFENNEPEIFGRDSKNAKDGKNDGGVVTKKDQFAFAMMPNVRFDNPNNAHYRFALITQIGADNSKYTVDFYNQECTKIANVPQCVRNSGDKTYATNLVFSIEKENIEYVRISDQTASGVLLPKMKQQQSNSDYTFAIDFGTSNTHIVCKSDNFKTQPFEITEADKQINIGLIGVQGNYIEPIFRELIPELVGEQQISKFPMRSALSAAKSTNWNQAFFALGQANFAYLYEKKAVPTYNNVLTNLKWSNNQFNTKQLQCYIESLFFAMRNKVVLNDGRLDTTKIIWTYPLSMTLAHLNNFKQVWEDAYKKYFSSNLDNLYDINESVAPYHYYKTINNDTINNIATIDIGGGTTDVVIANHGKVKYLTSFRFASNSIFGDLSENNEGELNGIIRQFKPEIEAQINANSLNMINEIYEELKAKNNSADIASLFFSLKDNKELTDKNIDIDFNRLLQLDNTQKINFLIFYCAILYHLAKIMKAKELDMPRHIGFSGNGAKVINILTTDKSLLETLTKTIFEQVYGSPYPKNGLTVILMDNPKEATSSGAIMTGRKEDFNEIKRKKLILLGTDSDTFAPDNLTYGDVVKDIKNYIDKVETETEQFFKFLFSLNKGETSFRDNFDIDQTIVSLAQDICQKDIDTYAENKLQQKLNEVGKQDKIEETMFFYPLSGVLHNLANQIQAYVAKNIKKTE